MMCWRASSSALISSTVLLFLLHCGTNIVEGVAATEYTDRFQECPPENETCTYYFKVQEKLTMILKKDLVYADKGKLYKFDESPTDANVTDVPVDEVVTVDGYNRMAIAVNNVIPGPAIIVYENQKVIVHVHNYLLSDSVTIHWHGLHMKKTPWMDGVGWVSQCPIASGQTFTYNFTASPKGTFWYHSHVGAQRSNGLFGAFIIKEKPVTNNTAIKPEEKIMVVGDWHHESSEEVYIKMVYGNFKGRIKFKTSETLDGGRFSGVPWVSGLINGKGRYYNPTTNETIEAPLEHFKVEKSKTYRFRVIGHGTIYPLRVSVDNHNISVVASDGYDVTPEPCESFIINPGERYDFLVKADQDVGSYWVRALSMEANKTHHEVRAIFQYKGADADKEPTTQRQNCDKTECVVINCPFRYFPSDMRTRCILLSELTSVNPEPVPEFVENDSQEHFLNFAFPGESVTPGCVNGRKFEFPGVNSLYQDEQLGVYNCDRHDCGDDKVCYCHYQLEIPYGKTIQMVWMNVGSGAGWGHPMHLHGHSFYVLKMAYPPQNATTGRLYNVSRTENELFNKDINCGDKGLQFCNEGKWRNSSWENGNVPGLNMLNPPRKDTLIIPTGAYAVIRIRSDNPGKWFLHCHIEVHALDGMAMIINEAEDHHSRQIPPKGFPVCQNFYNDHSRDTSYVKKSDAIEHCEDNTTVLLTCVIVLAAILFILLVGIVCRC